MTASRSLAGLTADATLGRAAAQLFFGRFIPANGRSSCRGSMTNATRKRCRPFGRCSRANRQ